MQFKWSEECKFILDLDGTSSALNGFQLVSKTSITCPSGKFLNNAVMETSPKKYEKVSCEEHSMMSPTWPQKMFSKMSKFLSKSVEFSL
jgi:hypothetical protein